jgi:hypothetical protein
VSDASHIVRLTQAQRHRLANWLAHPNGACILDRATFESVEDGGILVRTKDYGAPEAASAAEVVSQALSSVAKDSADTAQKLAAKGTDLAEAQIEAAIAERLVQVAIAIEKASRR